MSALRTMRRRTSGGVAGLVVLIVALSGCSGEQSSPEGVLKAAYAAINKGEFTNACKLIDDQAKTAMATFGSTCEVAMSKEYPADKRAHMSNVKVNMDSVNTSTDVVKIPAEAVTFDGQPSNDGDTTMVKRDNKWWITASR